MITYSEIRNLQRKEKESTSLQDLGQDFIGELAEYIQDKRKILSKNKEQGNPFSEEMESKARSEMENALRVIDMLFQLREKKIIYQAIMSAKKDVKIYNTSNMLDYEKSLFEQTLKLIKSHRKKISHELSSQEKIKKEEKVSKTKMLRLTGDVNSFVWEGEEYGPFKKEDAVNLSEELADLLIKRGKAEEIKNEDTKKTE